MQPPPPRSETDKLVDFDAPPVTEVVLSVQFVAPVVDIAVLAAFTTAIKPTAPHVSHQHVLPRMEETFDAPTFAPSFQIVDEIASLPRTWFQGPAGYLVQLQPDRLTLNWRRDMSPDAYPGYLAVRDRFNGHLRDLQAAVEGAGYGLPPIDICEVAYVNPIEVPGDQGLFAHPDLGRLINRVAPSPADFLGQPEDAQYNARWRISNPARPTQPIGRLHVSASPHIAPDGRTALYLVSLTAHVLPDREEDGYDALNIAHEQVVLGFKDLTTPEMHEHWKVKETT